MIDNLQPPVDGYTTTNFTRTEQKEPQNQEYAQYDESTGNLQNEVQAHLESGEEAPERNNSDDKPAQEKPAQTETSKEYNLRVLREKAKAAEQRAEEASRRAEEERRARIEAEERYKDYSPRDNKNTKREEPEEVYEEIPDDELIEGRHLKKIEKRYRESLEKMRREAEEREREREKKEQIRQFEKEHPDAAQVLSRENLDVLASIYPHDYASAFSNPSDYSKLQTAYNQIKRYGIMEEVESNERIDKNLSKPRAAASSTGQRRNDEGLGTLDQYGVERLTEADKAKVREQIARNKGYHF